MPSKRPRRAAPKAKPGSTGAQLAPDDLRYRDIIDALVGSCREGQGQIAARRARSGVWNAHITRASSPEQHAMNRLLADLSASQRATLAKMLEQEFVSGVHEALAVLYAKGVQPLDAAYEGSPFHDFVGRLADWEWPTSGGRRR